MLIYKIIATIFVVICGSASFLAEKVLAAITKRTVKEKQVIGFKFLMLAIIVIIAILVKLPDII